MIYRRLLVLIMLFAVLVGCASEPTDPVKMYPHLTEHQLFAHGQNAMIKGNYDDTISYFETLDARYPFGQYTRQAHLDMIYAYYQNNDNSSALVSADRYIRLYPRDKHVDYAYYMRGLMAYDENHGPIESFFGIDFSNRDLAQMEHAFHDFSHLVTHFPTSRYAMDARARMIKIRNMIARHNLTIAKYYFDKHAYVAAANRANEIVTHFQESSSIQAALKLQVKSYRAMNLPQQADSVCMILKKNFNEEKC